MHAPHGWGWLIKVVTSTHLCALWPMARAVWSLCHVGSAVSPAGCINSSNYRALGHEHTIVSFAPGRRVLVVGLIVWFGYVVCGSNMWEVVEMVLVIL